MPGIEEDIERAKAAGFVRTGSSGRNIEYEIYTCARSGLRLAIPLGNAGYVVRAPFPDYTIVLRTGLIDEAFSFIARAPRHPSPAIQPELSGEALRAHVARWVEEVRSRPSVPTFPPLDDRQPRTAGEGDGARDPSTEATDEAPAPGRRSPGTVWRRARAGILLLVGALLAALGLVAFGWAASGVLVVPMMYFMGLGRAACALGGTIAGAAWAAAACTWSRPRTFLMVSGAAAVAALAYHLTGVVEGLFGPGSAVYGAIVGASLVSAARERPVLRRSVLAACALAGGAVGAVSGGTIDGSSPHVAIWLSALSVHGLIAVSTPRLWRRT